MANGKQLVVLTGGGRKGIVKLSALAGAAKGSCSLDFRPETAYLYLIGDNIAQIELKDLNTTFEVPFLSSDSVSCLVRSSSVTMFGGPMPHSEILKRVDSHIRSQKKSSPPSRDEAPSSPPQNGESSQRSQNLHPDDPRLSESSSQTSSSQNAEISQTPHPQSEGSKISGAAMLTDAPISQNNGTNSQTPQHTNVLSQDAPQSAPTSDVSAQAALGDALRDWTRFDGNNFYYAVRPQLDEMFVRYPEDALLNASVPNSKWVRIDAPDGAYSVGILYDADDPVFICYAVPEPRPDRRPPLEIADMCVWLPVSSADAVGYWVIYQSAQTGALVK